MTELWIAVVLVAVFGGWIWFLKVRINHLRDRLDQIETAKKRTKKKEEPVVSVESEPAAQQPGIQTFELK